MGPHAQDCVLGHGCSRARNHATQIGKNCPTVYPTLNTMARKTRIISSPAPTTPFPHLFGYLAVSVLCLAAGTGLGYKLASYKTVPAATVSASPDQVNLDRSVGNAAFDQKNWPAAIEGYSTAIAAGANDPDIYTDLGTAYRFNNQPQLALQEYQTAQAKWPAHENSLFNQGGVYAFSLNEPDQAIKSWQSYLLKFPNGTHATEAEQLITDVKAHSTAKP